MSNETELSEYIIARRTFTYDVKEIKECIRDLQGDPDYEVSDEEVWDLVYGWVDDDMRSPLSRHDLSYVDENGNEL